VNDAVGGVGSVIERFQLRFIAPARDCWRVRRGKVLPSRGVGSHEMERSLNETFFRSGFSGTARLFGSKAASESPRGRVKAHQRLGEFDSYVDWNEATDGRDSTTCSVFEMGFSSVGEGGSSFAQANKSQ
jgi:hypothetical protein